MHRVQKLVGVPDHIIAIGSLGPCEYRDATAVEAPAAPLQSPEDWVRLVFEGAPTVMRWFLLAGWRAGLGLRLAPRHSADQVLGWPIVHRGPNWVMIEQRSRFLTAHQVFWIGPDQLVQATFVRYDHPLASWVWPPVSVVHRRVIPYLLGRATRPHARSGVR